MQKRTLTELKKILFETLETSAPTMDVWGETLEEIGKQTGYKPIEVVGDALDKLADVLIFTVQLLAEKDITLIDDSITRSLETKLLAAQVVDTLAKR
jgi:DNA-binding ferritin-like protein (Dps family)